MYFHNYESSFHIGTDRQKEDIGDLIFSGGEVHITLQGLTLKRLAEKPSDPVLVKARLNSSDNIMRLVMLNDALKRQTSNPRDLYIPYFPYARADRVMPGGGGDALGVRAFADIINGMGFRRVMVTDPHSNVVEAVVNNCVNIHLEKDLFFNVSQMEDDQLTVVAPDAGSIKRATVAAGTRYFPLVRMEKDRDTSTGKITGMRLLDELPKGRVPVIVDDICDGGRTFVEAAKVLRKAGARKVILCVTHGIFSNGLDELQEHLTRVYTTNSVKPLQSTKFLKVEDVF